MAQFAWHTFVKENGKQKTNAEKSSRQKWQSELNKKEFLNDLF